MFRGREGLLEGSVDVGPRFFSGRPEIVVSGLLLLEML
jgi:hypothetical protein